MTNDELTYVVDSLCLDIMLDGKITTSNTYARSLPSQIDVQCVCIRG